MRPMVTALSIVGAVALLSSVQDAAAARLRFGPAAVLRAFAAPLGLFGGGRVARRHHGRATAATDPRRAGDAAPAEPAAATAEPVAMNGNGERASLDMTAFWPSGADDLVAYVLFPKGRDDRFWAHGYDSILQGAFVSATPEPARRARPIARRVGDAGGTSTPVEATAAACEPSRISADRLIERIERAIAPGEPQRDTIDALHTALTRAVAQIDAACPAPAATNPTERLRAIGSRIWAMHDAVLTLRQPVEKFFAALNDEQRWRLLRLEGDAEAADTTGSAASTPPTAASGPASKARSNQDAAMAAGEPCGAGAENMIEPLRAIERALRPNEQQRAALEGLRMQVAGMAQLIASACPSYPLLGPMDRVAAVADRLDVMLFAVMTLSPALPDFYDSLSDGQKAALERAIRQFRRPADGG
jgi:hypothetical protein